MPAQAAARASAGREPAVAGALRGVLPAERVLASPLDRFGRSADASIYRLIPEAVVRPAGVAERQVLFAFARANARSLTFRAAGTSLSGQAVTDDILVELGPTWRGVRVLDAGRRIWVQPGVVGGYVNRLPAPLGYRLGLPADQHRSHRRHARGDRGELAGLRPPNHRHGPRQRDPL